MPPARCVCPCTAPYAPASTAHLHCDDSGRGALAVVYARARDEGIDDARREYGVAAYDEILTLLTAGYAPPGRDTALPPHLAVLRERQLPVTL